MIETLIASSSAQIEILRFVSLVLNLPYYTACSLLKLDSEIACPSFTVSHRNMQNTQGDPTCHALDRDPNIWETAVALQRDFGFGIFFDGISPKLLRAALNHSVTFFCYDLILRSIAENA